MSVYRIIGETKTGITYHHDSPEELATKLKYIISNKNKFYDLCSNGKKAILSKYNWETDKLNLLNIYSK